MCAEDGWAVSIARSHASLRRRTGRTVKRTGFSHAFTMLRMPSLLKALEKLLHNLWGVGQRAVTAVARELAGLDWLVVLLRY